jgi:glycosyltransferase involved in cell wall biosynthesis
MSVSVLIMTLNEEKNLPGAIQSVPRCDDVVVYDSISSDRTQEIARTMGARVVERKFDSFGKHQTWAMENIDFKHRWVFMLDADERMTDALWDELVAVAERWEKGEATHPKDPVALYCGRRNFFMGKWIKNAMPPGNNMRFFQPKRIRFEREVHQVPVPDGSMGYLKGMFDHYNFSKGIGEWFDRHNRYATAECKETMRALRENPVVWKNLFSKDRNTRRLELKNISFRLPFRPFFKFGFMYILQRGFLDGRAGLTYCTLQSVYEYLIVLKVREQRMGFGDGQRAPDDKAAFDKATAPKS